MYCYIQTPILTLLYRKDNSALDCFCCYDVYLSCLYISRRNKAVHIAAYPPCSSPCTGILTCFLFNNQEYLSKKYFLFDHLGLVLRSTYSWINTIARKPFLTSAVKVLTWLFATTTKICTNAWSKQDQSLYSSSQLLFLMHHTSLQIDN